MACRKKASTGQGQVPAGGGGKELLLLFVCWLGQNPDGGKC